MLTVASYQVRSIELKSRGSVSFNLIHTATCVVYHHYGLYRHDNYNAWIQYTLVSPWADHIVKHILVWGGLGRIWLEPLCNLGAS
jgi:hypothetical protein